MLKIMNKLELKHLAPYLPYNLKGNVSDHEYNEHWLNERIETVCFADQVITFSDATDVYLAEPNETEFKPLLKPLSKLKNWNSVDSKTIQIQLLELSGDVSLLSYQLFEVLLENHFDVFGLIEKGLAVDKNTL
jgi:hypothetical protein